jgi:hypothetical protein
METADIQLVTENLAGKCLGVEAHFIVEPAQRAQPG